MELRNLKSASVQESVTDQIQLHSHPKNYPTRFPDNFPV